MSKFTGPLAICFEEDGRLATILEPLTWEMDFLGSGEPVTVPEGFMTDGATVPKYLWWFMPPWGDVATRAAVLHDYLLWVGIPRADSDKQFRLALLALGTSPWRAWVLWAAVRLYSRGFEMGVFPEFSNGRD